MSDISSIEWTDYTFNPWEGCTKVSPGCLNCYAEARNARWGGGVAGNWGRGAPRRRTSEANWKKPLTWNRKATVEDGFPRSKVFCASLADWLDDEVPIEWLVDLLALIAATPNLDWQLLTKRPENWRSRMQQVLALRVNQGLVTYHEKCPIDLAWSWLEGIPPSNVWVGTSVEDQLRADERISHLKAIPSFCHFLSCEPLLERVSLLPFGADPLLAGIDWVIAGGESGSGARPCHAEWLWDLQLQCQAGGVPFFCKQLGANVITQNANAMDWPDGTIFVDDPAVNELAAGARVKLQHRKGGDLQEWPTELQVRQFPDVIPF